MKDKRSFWRDGLSIDESKFSVLIILTVVLFGYIMYCDITRGSINVELTEIMKGLIAAIVGVNVFEGMSKAYTNRPYRQENQANHVSKSQNQYPIDQIDSIDEDSTI